MVVISFFRHSNGRKICGFSISGHAGFGSFGKDVLCAAISSAVYLVINTVTDVIKVKPLVLEVFDGDLEFVLKSRDADICELLIKGLELHLSEMSKQYSKNMLVKYRNIKE